MDWRGIFRLRDPSGQRWVLRLIKRADAAQVFHATAEILEWLKRQPYPAPRVHRTRDGRLNGVQDSWALLLLSFIEGDVIAPAPPELYLLSARLAQLHALASPASATIRLSRCHPEQIATRTLVQLNTGISSAPRVVAPLFKSLGDSMRTIVHMEHGSLRITHGDCWYRNAVKADAREVHLIDWDNVGLGLPVLDLGYLLLSSHFLLEEPFSIPPEEEVVQAILDGYRENYHLSQEEVRSLPQAVHFPLAFHLGMYFENNPHVREDDLFIKKTQQRFSSAAVIGQMAEAYSQET